MRLGQKLDMGAALKLADRLRVSLSLTSQIYSYDLHILKTGTNPCHNSARFCQTDEAKSLPKRPKLLSYSNFIRHKQFAEIMDKPDYDTGSKRDKFIKTNQKIHEYIRSLTPEERQEWKEKSLEFYSRQKADFDALPEEIKEEIERSEAHAKKKHEKFLRKQLLKEANRPSRSCLTTSQLYSQDWFQQHKDEMSWMKKSNVELFIMMTEDFKKLSAEELQKYTEEATKRREIYHEEMANWVTLMKEQGKYELIPTSYLTREMRQEMKKRKCETKKKASSEKEEQKEEQE